MSYVVQGTVQINLVTEGDLSGVVNIENLIINNTKSMAGAQQQMNQQSSNGAYLIRRLAIDLRMFSVGLQQIRREYEGVNPLFDSFAQSLQVAVAAATSVVGAVSAVSSISRILKQDTLGLGSAVSQLTGGGVTSFAALSASAVALTVALAGLAAIVAGVFTFEYATGITGYREEMAKLQEQIESLDASLRNLGVEQSALNAEAAAYTAQMAQVNRQIELQGYATAEQTAQLAALESALSDVKTRQAEVNAETARSTFEQKQATDSAQDYQDAIDKLYESLMKVIGERTAGIGAVSGFLNLIPSMFGLNQGQLGGEVTQGGAINVERGEVLMQKEQVATMLQGGGGGYTISISLAGANIKSDVDLENGLRKGAKAAVEEIQLLEMRRRRVNTKF
jgi:hypothetical protein